MFLRLPGQRASHNEFAILPLLQPSVNQCHHLCSFSMLQNYSNQHPSGRVSNRHYHASLRASKSPFPQSVQQSATAIVFFQVHQIRHLSMFTSVNNNQRCFCTACKTVPAFSQQTSYQADLISVAVHMLHYNAEFGILWRMEKGETTLYKYSGPFLTICPPRPCLHTRD